MKKNRLQLLGALLIIVLFVKTAHANLPPPHRFQGPGESPEHIVVIGLGLLVVFVVVVAFSVVQAIKRERRGVNSPPISQ